MIAPYVNVVSPEKTTQELGKGDEKEIPTVDDSTQTNGNNHNVNPNANAEVASINEESSNDLYGDWLIVTKGKRISKNPPRDKWGKGERLDLDNHGIIISLIS